MQVIGKTYQLQYILPPASSDGAVVIMAHLPPPAASPCTPIIVEGDEQVLPSTMQMHHLPMATYHLSQIQVLALVILNPVVKGESG